MMKGETDTEWIDFIPKKIVLVLSDPTLERIVKFGLVKRGHSVISVSPSQGARIEAQAVDLLISDSLNFSVNQTANKSYPIVVLRDPDHSGAFEPNASSHVSYLDKPFEFENLLSLMDSLLNKNLNFVQSLRVSRKQRAFCIHHIQFDPIGMEILCEDHLIKLTWREFHVFLALLQGGGNTVSAKELVELLAERISSQRTSLTQCINKLRHKLTCCHDRIQILTEINEGYRLQISILE